MATESARNARLDALESAANSWFDKRTKEINDRVALAKKLLKGRTGSERLTNATSLAATGAIVDEIDAFLTGD